MKRIDPKEVIYSLSLLLQGEENEYCEAYNQAIMDAMKSVHHVVDETEDEKKNAPIHVQEFETETLSELDRVRAIAGTIIKPCGADALTKIAQHIIDGKNLEAVKLCRAETESYLKEAKHAVDKVRLSAGKMTKQQYYTCWEE